VIEIARKQNGSLFCLSFFNPENNAQPGIHRTVHRVMGLLPVYKSISHQFDKLSFIDLTVGKLIIDRSQSLVSEIS